jgi:hypothetical protein
MINSFLRKAALAFLTGGLTLFVWSGCNNSEEVGLNLTTPGERFHYVIDSSALVEVATLRQDSLTSEKRTSSLLGCMNDPVFGRTYAHLLTQLRLSSNEVEFGAGAILDSAMLLMKYQNWYGDTTTIQNIKVYEMLQDIYVDTTYYSNKDISGFYDPSNPVANFSYRPTPDRDSVLIRMDDAFGQRLLNTDTAYLSNNTEWLKYFRGLYLEAQTTEQDGSIISYNFSGGKSRLTLYYHNDSSDSLKYEIVINSNCTWMNLFSHDYSRSTIQAQINDSVYSHPLAFLQGSSGLRGHVKISFPDTVMAKLESGIAINKAELILKVAEDPNLARFERPKTLRVFNAKADGTNEFIDDLTLGEAYYGGIYDEETGTYRFNIGRHIQNLLHPDPSQRKDNTGLFLVLSEERTSAARLILDNKPGSVQLILTYTPLQ